MTANLYIRPDVDKVYDLLREFNGLLVHFSGTPKGAGQPGGKRLWFPDDLNTVLAGNAQGGLSASVVKPGDYFADHWRRNAVGCVGVILGLQSPQSVRCADASDCGSSTDLAGNRECLAPPSISLQELRLTIVNRRADSYNEWVVANYVPLGILAMPPYETSVPAPYSSLRGAAEVPEWMAGDMPVTDVKFLDLPQVRTLFPDQPLYTMVGSELALVGQDGLSIPIAHEQIYSRKDTHTGISATATRC